MHLQQLRKKVGISQAELAKLANVSRSAISMIERGENRPSVDLAKKLGGILGVPWQNFF